MDSSLVAKILAFVLYLGFMVYIGLRNVRGNASSSDFFLGGRRMGPWVTALSAEASDMSGWLLMGLPGLAYLGGIREAFWTALGLTLGTYLNWLLVAKPLRTCTIHFGDAITIPEFLTNRFCAKSHVISVVSVVFILLFFTIYTASGFVACAKLFNSVFAIPYRVGLVIGLAVILSYTVLGGYRAVCTTDFVQGSLMFLALIVVGTVMMFTLGGPADAFAKVGEFSARAMNGEFTEEMRRAFTANGHYSAMNVVSALAWGLGYFGMPHIIVRFMGIESNAAVKISRRIATVWVVVAFAGAVLAGSLGSAFLLTRVDGGVLAVPEAVISEAIQQISLGNALLVFIGGVFLCAILAAAMSTADSQLLVASSAFSRDIYKGIIRKDADERTVLRVSRIAVFVIAAVAFFLSLSPDSSIFALVSYAWAGFGSTFGPLVLLALFYRGMTARGAVAGLIAGGVTVVAWHNLHGGLFDVYEILPGFLACGIFAVAVSVLDKQKDPEMLKEFDGYRKLLG